MMVESWYREVSPGDLGVRMVLWWSGEISNKHDLCCLSFLIYGLKSDISYLSEGPVDLHGPEGNNVHIVHETVWVRHLYFLFLKYYYLIIPSII